jgi:hypothetical protein
MPGLANIQIQRDLGTLSTAQNGVPCSCMRTPCGTPGLSVHMQSNNTPALLERLRESQRPWHVIFQLRLIERVSDQTAGECHKRHNPARSEGASEPKPNPLLAQNIGNVARITQIWRSHPTICERSYRVGCA